MVERDEYMREGFDPQSLVMPQLRSILVEHQVPFSSAARKGELVQLFNQHVLPTTANLRKKNAAIVASSSGIIDMRDRTSDGEPTPAATPAKRKPGRPRKSEAVAVPASASTSAIPARSKSATQARAINLSESEQSAPAPEQSKKRGRPRKSVPAPVVVDAPSEPETTLASPPSRERQHVSFVPESPDAYSADPNRRAKRLSRGGAGDGRGGGRSDEDGTFSDSNPFQSGSEASPAAGPASKAAASARRARRKTGEASSASTSSLARALPNEHLAPPTSTSGRATQTSPSASSRFHNYMDHAVAASTPPRLIDRISHRSPGASSAGNAADDEDDLDDLSHEEQDRQQNRVSADAENAEEEEDPDDTMSPSAFAKMRIVRRQREKQRRKDRDASRSPWDLVSDSAWTLLCVVFVAWTMWYAKETRAIGFCDTGSNTNPILQERAAIALAEAREANTTLEESQISLLPARLQPTCTPCPPHAECHYGQVLGCASDDWVLQPNLRSKVPLATWFLPLSYTEPRCYPDTQKLVLASELSLAISHMLSDFKGEIVCGTQKPHATVRKLPKKIVSENGNLTYAIDEAAIKQSMSATRDAKLDDDYFEQIWYMALFELTDPRSNVVRIPVSTQASSSQVAASTKQGLDGEAAISTTYFLAAKQPALSISCRSRLALRGWVRRARLYLFILGSAVLGFFYLRYRLSSARAETLRVSTLVQAALDRLQEQEYLHGVDPVLYPDDFVPLSHLRDHILSECHDPKTRNRLWKKVARVVEHNSNVRTRQAQKKGEWLRVWQWIGVVPYQPPSSAARAYLGSAATSTPDHAAGLGHPVV
ncbi:hypothetical protein BCV70DRAFT_197065 [Testicularia cyperi]|uniref:Man1/Src1 C-terminal domain-containing protein n=1 Tax=Testicularia cyperi TaxID=1882483 RepID=A0A317XYF2_9BASI|nr:hypothetical protein BCV70DRAFT_197065 [Testicularia cyperi]